GVADRVDDDIRGYGKPAQGEGQAGLSDFAQRAGEQSDCSAPTAFERSDQVIHESQVPAENVCTIEQHRHDRLANVAMIIPFGGGGDEEMGVIQPVRRHYLTRLHADRHTQMLTSDAAHCLNDIANAARLEVISESGDELGRYVGSPCFGIDGSACTAD